MFIPLSSFFSEEITSNENGISRMMIRMNCRRHWEMHGFSVLSSQFSLIYQMISCSYNDSLVCHSSVSPVTSDTNEWIQQTVKTEKGQQHWHSSQHIYSFQDHSLQWTLLHIVCISLLNLSWQWLNSVNRQWQSKNKKSNNKEHLVL
jgi:hypothetical protein